MFGFGFGWVLKGRIRPEKRELHEQPYTDIEKSGTIRFASGVNLSSNIMYEYQEHTQNTLDWRADSSPGPQQT